jgi:Spy/CpxP family protein refolding chaperone
MNARFAHVLSRLSIVSVVAVSAVGAAACNGRASSSSSPAPVAAASEGEAAPAAAAAHHPGQQIFREVRALDLADAQRAGVDDLEQNLVADLAPHRETFRQVAQFFAASVESGEIDPAQAKAHEAAVSAAILDGKASFVTAMNGLHDLLDAGQRATLVARLHDHARRGVTRDAQGAERPEGPISKLALQIGLTEDQKLALRDAVQQGADELFPDHAARRQAHEAQMKALAEAFVRDDFDAADHDLGAPEHAVAQFTEIVSRSVDVSGRLLSASQRSVLAGLIRTRAEKL